MHQEMILDGFLDNDSAALNYLFGNEVNSKSNR